MKLLYLFSCILMLVSCGGGTDTKESSVNTSNNTIWKKPIASDGFLLEASNLNNIKSLNNYMPLSDNIYAKWNPQIGNFNSGIKLMMFGTPNSLCPSNKEGELLPFNDNILSELNINPLNVANELRFEPQSTCGIDSSNLHGANYTFLDGKNIWLKTQSSNESSVLLKTFNDSGQDGTGVNKNIIGNFISFRFPFLNYNEAVKPFSKNNTARISLSTNIKVLNTGNSIGITQPKEQIMATIANPDCYEKKLSLCQINILINVAIARTNVTNWSNETWSLKSKVWLDSAQGNLPIWESFLPYNGESFYFNETNKIALISRGSETVHNPEENKVFNAEISFESFKTAIRIASSKILKKNLSTNTECIDCKAVFGEYWDNVNYWVLLDASVGQEVYDDSHGNGTILSNFDWLFIGSKPE